LTRSTTTSASNDTHHVRAFCTLLGHLDLQTTLCRVLFFYSTGPSSFFGATDYYHFTCNPAFQSSLVGICFEPVIPRSSAMLTLSICMGKEFVMSQLCIPPLMDIIVIICVVSSCCRLPCPSWTEASSLAAHLY